MGCAVGDAGEGNAAQGGLISPRSSSSSGAPIAQSLKGLFQRQPHPPATLPTGGLLSSRRNSSEVQTSTPGVCLFSQYWIYYVKNCLFRILRYTVYVCAMVSCTECLRTGIEMPL